MSRLSTAYYLNPDVVELAKDLLGKVLCTNIEGIYSSGIICETEAYEGITDKASHAYGGRRTQRTETLYSKGGISYVYLCYGIHHLFNVVSNVQNIPHAVLIRGIVPLDGKEHILVRRKSKKFQKNSCIGPGKVSQALGITTQQNGLSLQDDKIWLEDRNIIPSTNKIISSKRIGIDYAQEDADLLYRFECFDFQAKKNNFQITDN
tara:strand:- start:479 stop:1096 length:618 start_codon:yes stop_codon:yes gene_type:complete